MNHTEAVTVCRVVAAMCPSQKFDEHTPDAWALVLDDVRLADAQEAVVTLGKRQTFISPAEIRAEVARIRNRRIGDTERWLVPPAELDDDVEGARRWLAAAKARLGDGEPLDDVQGDRGVLRTRPVAALVVAAGRTNTLPNDVRRAHYEQAKANLGRRGAA
ncbi:hypothetical protein ACFVJS_03985 [Nocardioides sp. NPDC057772]|uniref:hypothetical protein n=1 Tax=Nocardioides sp. NPDC057772 TaxID=3346245 RepID=UPI00366D58F9